MTAHDDALPARLTDDEILRLWQGGSVATRPVLGSRKVLDFARAVEQRARAALAARAEPVYGIFDPDYARVFTKARCIARNEGYALAAHGSFTRDLDLLAVPWADHACDAEYLVDRIADACGLKPNGHPPGDKPHGRRAWTLLFPAFGDPRFIDLSVFAAPPALPPEAQEAMRMAADALRAIVRHWDEFGPEHGFDEVVDQARRTLEPGPPLRFPHDDMGTPT